MSDLSGPMPKATEPAPKAMNVRWAVFARTGDVKKDILRGLLFCELAAAHYAETFGDAQEWIRRYEDGFRRFVAISIGENLDVERWEKEDAERVAEMLKGSDLKITYKEPS